MPGTAQLIWLLVLVPPLEIRLVYNLAKLESQNKIVKKHLQFLVKGFYMLELKFEAEFENCNHRIRAILSFGISHVPALS